MSRGIVIGVIVVLLVALAAVGGMLLLVYTGTFVVAQGTTDVVATTESQPVRSITVVGNGKAAAKPDIARVMVGVDRMAPTANEAADEANAGIEAIMEAVKGQGVEERDIQTAYFSVYPEMDYREGGSGEVVGYRASSSLNVTVRDITKVGDILDQATTAGANNISGVNFTVDNSDPIEDQARQEAIGDAGRRANDLARLMGVSVGEVISISEVISGGPIPFSAERAVGMGGGGGGIAPGELEITSQVQVTYAIQ